MMGDTFIYSVGNKTSTNVKIQDGTVWLTRGQVTELFDKTRLVILELFNSVFSGGELSGSLLVRKKQTTDIISNSLEIPNSHIENPGFPNFVETVQ